MGNKYPDEFNMKTMDNKLAMKKTKTGQFKQTVIDLFSIIFLLV